MRDHFARRVERNQGVGDPLGLTGNGLDETRDEMDAELARDLGERPHERSVQRLRVLDPVGPESGREVRRVLGEDDEQGSPRRGRFREHPHLKEVRLFVVTGGELGDRDRRGASRRGSSRGLRRHPVRLRVNHGGRLRRRKGEGFRSEGVTMPTLRIIPVAALLTLLLAACGPGTPDPEAGDPSGSSTPTPTETETDAADDEEADDEAESDEADAPEPETGLTASDRANIQDAITSGNTAPIEGYLSNPVRVIIMSSECCWDVTPAEAVSDLSYITGAPGPWNFSLPSATTDPWHTNEYYGYLFTGDDITGRASDGTIVSFGISGGQVTTILMGFEEGFTY